MCDSQSLELAHFSESDLDQILTTENAASSHPWRRENFLSSLKAGYICVGLRNQTHWLAHAIFLPGFESLELLILSVSPEYKRQGFASLLINKVIQSQSEVDCKQVLLEVRERNQAAIALYTKLGFKQVGRRKRYYADDNDNAVLFTLDITDKRS